MDYTLTLTKNTEPAITLESANVSEGPKFGAGGAVVELAGKYTYLTTDTFTISAVDSTGTITFGPYNVQESEYDYGTEITTLTLTRNINLDSFAADIIEELGKVGDLRAARYPFQYRWAQITNNVLHTVRDGIQQGSTPNFSRIERELAKYGIELFLGNTGQHRTVTSGAFTISLVPIDWARAPQVNLSGDVLTATQQESKQMADLDRRITFELPTPTNPGIVYEGVGNTKLIAFGGTNSPIIRLGEYQEVHFGVVDQEAKRVFNWFNSKTATVTIPINHRIQIRDSVRFDDSNWIVTSASFDFSSSIARLTLRANDPLAMADLVRNTTTPFNRIPTSDNPLSKVTDKPAAPTLNRIIAIPGTDDDPGDKLVEDNDGPQPYPFDTGEILVRVPTTNEVVRLRNVEVTIDSDALESNQVFTYPAYSDPNPINVLIPDADSYATYTITVRFENRNGFSTPSSVRFRDPGSPTRKPIISNVVISAKKDSEDENTVLPIHRAAFSTEKAVTSALVGSTLGFQVAPTAVFIGRTLFGSPFVVAGGSTIGQSLIYMGKLSVGAVRGVVVGQGALVGALGPELAKVLAAEGITFARFITSNLARAGASLGKALLGIAAKGPVAIAGGPVGIALFAAQVVWEASKFAGAQQARDGWWLSFDCDGLGLPLGGSRANIVEVQYAESIYNPDDDTWSSWGRYQAGSRVGNWETITELGGNPWWNPFAVDWNGESFVVEPRDNSGSRYSVSVFSDTTGPQDEYRANTLPFSENADPDHKDPLKSNRRIFRVRTGRTHTDQDGTTHAVWGDWILSPIMYVGDTKKLKIAPDGTRIHTETYKIWNDPEIAPPISRNIPNPFR